MNNDITTPLSLKQPAPVKLSPLCRLQEDTRRHTADKGGLSMQPSFSVTLEPGLERGIPWGCDLYTFVTSAAGHMMRTLHKPRKNRRSKRQVNHRRFLHNMIQRKFADIEAANHQLVSALYFKEERKNVSSLPSQEPETLNQSGSPSRGGYLQDPDKCSVHTGADGISKSRSDICVGSHEKKQSDSEHLLNQQPKSQPTTWTTRKNNQSNTGQKKESQNHKLVEFSSISSPMDHLHGAQLVHTEYYNDEGQLESANSFSEDSKTAQRDSGFIQIGQNMDTSPVFSPGLCPLSLDSCDFSIQTFTDISTCTQAQKNITDISEGQWSDIMDLFSIGNKDEGAFMDVEANFESICACQGDGGADTIGFADQSESVTEKICSKSSEMEDLHCEAGEYGYEYGHSCHGVQGVTTNHFLSALRQREDTTEIEFDNFKISQGIIQNQLPTLTSCHYNVSELQTHQQPQEESPCMLMNNQNFTPFDGVAQSFSVPLLNPEHRPIPTPPREDDWLFTDILQDRTSPDRKIPPIMF